MFGPLFSQPMQPDPSSTSSGGDPITSLLGTLKETMMQRVQDAMPEPMEAPPVPETREAKPISQGAAAAAYGLGLFSDAVLGRRDTAQAAQNTLASRQQEILQQELGNLQAMNMHRQQVHMQSLQEQAQLNQIKMAQAQATNDIDKWYTSLQVQDELNKKAGEAQMEQMLQMYSEHGILPSNFYFPGQSQEDGSGDGGFDPLTALMRKYPGLSPEEAWKLARTDYEAKGLKAERNIQDAQNLPRGAYDDWEDLQGLVGARLWETDSDRVQFMRGAGFVDDGDFAEEGFLEKIGLAEKRWGSPKSAGWYRGGIEPKVRSLISQTNDPEKIAQFIYSGLGGLLDVRKLEKDPDNPKIDKIHTNTGEPVDIQELSPNEYSAHSNDLFNLYTMYINRMREIGVGPEVYEPRWQDLISGYTNNRVPMWGDVKIQRQSFFEDQ